MLNDQRHKQFLFFLYSYMHVSEVLHIHRKFVLYSNSPVLLDYFLIFHFTSKSIDFKIVQLESCPDGRHSSAFIYSESWVVFILHEFSLASSGLIELEMWAEKFSLILSIV